MSKIEGIEVDDATRDRLASLSAMCGKPAHVVAAELLTAILEEDAFEHAVCAPYGHTIIRN
jgi:hypothetical protein